MAGSEEISGADEKMSAARFLPKTFDSGGVICSPLGRRATVDSIGFCQPLANSPSKNFCFWLNKNIEIRVCRIYATYVLCVNVRSLTRFANNRSSSLIRDYEKVLLDLNDIVNRELEKRGASISFDVFASEITRLDCFVDLRFKNYDQMNLFYDNTVKKKISHLTNTTEDFALTHYWHNNDNYSNSTQLLKLYHKENFDRKNITEELNRNKLRLECSYQNKNIKKILDAFAVKLPPVSHTVKTDKGTFQYQNKYKSNCFSLVNQNALNCLFEYASREILPFEKL